MRLQYTDCRNQDFLALIAELDLYLEERMGQEVQKTRYTRYNTVAELKGVCLIYEEGQAVGCGSFKEYDTDTAELKRMFVKSNQRKNGYGRMLVEALEEQARKNGYSRMILETGIRLEEAQSLYLHMGFHRIENYGPYQGNDLSICMERDLIEK